MIKQTDVLKSSGSPLTEKEINATKKSEINTECPSIAIMSHTKDKTYRLAWIVAVPLMLVLFCQVVQA